MENKKRLIDACALSETLQKKMDELNERGLVSSYLDGFNEAFRAIFTAPTVYAVEMPKGNPGDYIEWNNGAMRLPIYRISSVMICEGCMRYELKDFSPVVNHPCIERILTREEAEKALAEMGKAE